MTRPVLVSLGSLVALSCAGFGGAFRGGSAIPEPDDPGATLIHRAETRSGMCGDASYARLELAEAFAWCERVHSEANLHFLCRAGAGRADIVVSIRPDAPPRGGYSVRMRSKGPCWEPPALGLAMVSECGRMLVRRAHTAACGGS